VKIAMACDHGGLRLKKVLKEKGYSVAVGDEGGFAPNLENEEEALDVIIEAIKKAGYEPGKEIVLALDIASTEMYEEAQKIGKNGYYFWKSNILKTKEEMIKYIEDLCDKYPIISVEDGLAEEDWDSWKTLTVSAQMEETMFLGLRMMKGVSKIKFLKMYGESIVIKNSERYKRLYYANET